MDVHVSLVGRKDLAGEIYRQLRSAILDGTLAGGERLPPSRELARGLAVSRTTVMVAYDRLISEEFAEPRVGDGTYVTSGLNVRLPRPAGGAETLRPRAIWQEVPLPRILDRLPEYDFRAGIPDARLFPFDTWRRLIGRDLRRAAPGNGVYADPAGDRGLREAIARHTAIARGVRLTADDVIVTNGTQQAIDVVARALLDPGDLVAVEDPGYPPPRHLLTTLGARVAAVPVDREGIVVDAIPADARMVVVTPSHQFPLGVAMSLRRRIALLGWAEDHDAAIVEDDYDSEFRLGGRPIEPLQLLDHCGRVIYIGSFSKTLLPTMRLGFVVVPRSVRHAVHAAKFVADWHTPLSTQRALARFIDGGWFARHLRRMRAVYRARHERIVETLSRDFAELLEVVPAAAGLHVSARARTASPADIAAVIGRAARDGVGILALSTFAMGTDTHPGLLVGYGAIATERIDEGLARLRRAFGA